MGGPGIVTYASPGPFDDAAAERPSEMHTTDEMIETEPVRIVDGVRIFIHHVEPTEAERRRNDALWRELIALLLNDERFESRKTSVN
jgi:hypothetical protein